MMLYEIILYPFGELKTINPLCCFPPGCNDNICIRHVIIYYGPIFFQNIMLYIDIVKMRRAGLLCWPLFFFEESLNFLL